MCRHYQLGAAAATAVVVGGSWAYLTDHPPLVPILTCGVVAVIGSSLLTIALCARWVYRQHTVNRVEHFHTHPQHARGGDRHGKESSQGEAGYVPDWPGNGYRHTEAVKARGR